MNFDWGNFFLFLFIVSLIALAFAMLLGVWVIWRVRRLKIPENLSFFEALRLTPFSVVLFLDLLDFSLDIFAAPIAWAFLGRLGLQSLRGVTTLEAFIPGTQFIPTMTLSWFLARFLSTSLPETTQPNVIDGEATVIEPQPSQSNTIARY